MRRVASGSPEPLGVTLADGGANVAVHSAHATSIELCLFDASGATEMKRIALPERSGEVFHGFVPGLEAGTRYGLRAHGRWDPRAGHRFNPAKLLVDPYARALDRRFAWHPALGGAAADPLARDPRDTAELVPKAIATAPERPAPAGRPRVPWADTIVYELHVRGYTRTHPGVPEPLRGTCAGLAQPEAIAHLVRLGVTTVELMPLAAAIDERQLAQRSLTNYWGYNPVAWFVPDPRLAPGGIDELRRCVDALHAAGLEVVLDVVLNHSGEGDERGPTLSLRGLDNATYYRLAGNDPSRYNDDAGCGNTLALERPPVLRLALDVLRYYAEVAGVDGFRLDLATTLARRDGAFDEAAPLLQALAQDPVLRERRIVVEPWDIGPGGYRLGAFPAPWGEWNDRFRDDVRRFWRGDPGLTGALATRVAGSSDVFAARQRRPSRSVNFVAVHDGFTLADLVAYARKHNEANGEANRDGADANYSWNHGVEGASDDPAIAEARARDVRNLLATVLLSRGTPLLAMGDELGRTQRGSNNAYCQDNALTWIDWAAADRELIAFVGALAELRRRNPALRDDRWLEGTPQDESGILDVEWRRADGRTMSGGDWAGASALVAALYAPATARAAANRVVVAFHAGDAPLPVRWPEPRHGFAWRRAIDTSRSPPGEPPGDAVGVDDAMAARSVVVLVEEPATPLRKPHGGVDAAALDRLAQAAGIEGEWWDLLGEHHTVTPEAKRSLLAGMGLAVDTTDDARARLRELAAQRELRPLPASVVAGEGAAAVVALTVGSASSPRRHMLRVRLEDGAELAVPVDADALPGRRVVAADGRDATQRIATLPVLPVGVHTLSVDDAPDGACALLVAPARAFLPDALAAGERRLGLAAQLYALRRTGDQGIGDFTTLAQAAAATARIGGALVGINPLHALFSAERERASPYHPSDRRFLDPIGIDVERVAELAHSRAARNAFDGERNTFAALAARAEVDHVAVWRAKRAVLDACFAVFEAQPAADPAVAEFEQFCTAGGEALQRFALFEAIAAVHPRVPWFRWPAGLRRPDGPDVVQFAAANQRAIRFALYLQWQADRQLAAAAASARASGLAFGIYRDLAVGAAPDGAEAWAQPGLFAQGASIGAPPDPFAREGQNWSLPPPIPAAIAADACAAFRRLVAANMRHAGALRIDHVMGLTRLFWIPDGATPAEGTYVRYPLEQLLAALALESRRARCFVVGEDLGTVPAGLRDRLADADVLSSRVVWLERDGDAFVEAARYPAKAVACVSTHDLPTIAGWWTGADIAERQALGLIDATDAAADMRRRTQDKHRLVSAIERAGATPGAALDPDRAQDAAVTAAIHGFAGATPSALVLVQADDLAGETAAPNLPGTDRERPNWRRKLGVDSADLWTTAAGTQTLDACAARVGGARKPS